MRKLWEAHPDPQKSMELSKETSFWKQQHDVFVPPLLSQSAENECRQKIEALGVSQDEWFVCLHVREGGFRKDSGR